jgi:hypothetical protein
LDAPAGGASESSSEPAAGRAVPRVQHVDVLDEAVARRRGRRRAERQAERHQHRSAVSPPHPPSSF